MKVDRHLFLDLEDTIITPNVLGWRTVECINVELVRSIIERWKPDFIHLFSFAIHHDPELQKFKAICLDMVKNTFGIEFATTWRVDEDIIRMCCAELGMHPQCVDFQEMSSFWGKAGAFRLCMLQHFKNIKSHNKSVEVLLLDDVVINENFQWPQLNISGHIVNIDQELPNFLL